MNFIKKIKTLAILLVATTLSAQTDDTVLMTVADKDVTVGEFRYIYEKNNGDGANYSPMSLNEYIDLYIKFKLKVAEAKAMGLDTISVLNKELDGYRKQLTDSYIMDKEVIKALTKELYDRKKEDIRLSHILISISKRANAGEIESKRKAALDIFNRIKLGEDFATLAKKYSDDKSSAKMGGDFGWLTAKLPSGFYAFENAMYTLKKGEVSELLRTPLGWHIIKVMDKRHARGKIKVAHILKRTDKANPTIAKKEIDRIFAELANGADFADLAAKNSDDDKTAKKGGELAPFGIKVYEGSFEEAAFALAKNGDNSRPIKTKIGYHIIKRIEKIGLEDYPQFEAKSLASLKKDSRYETQKERVVEEIKLNARYKLNKNTFDKFVKKQTPEIYTYKWKATNMKDDVLFTYGGKKDYMLSDFTTYLRSNTRMRLRYDKKDPIAESVEKMLNEYVKETTLKYEQSNLEERHPEYKSLMREYEEGILLFEASKQEVWDKAAKDTLGLYLFYEENKTDYMWLPRADVAKYTVETESAKKAKDVYKCAKKKNDKKLLNKFNKKDTILTSEIVKIERASKAQAGMEWIEGARSEFSYDEKNGLATFKKILKIYQPTIKTLEESRGFVIADYQDQLEKEWVKRLNTKYDVKLNKDVVNQLKK